MRAFVLRLVDPGLAFRRNPFPPNCWSGLLVALHLLFLHADLNVLCRAQLEAVGALGAGALGPLRFLGRIHAAEHGSHL